MRAAFRPRHAHMRTLLLHTLDALSPVDDNLTPRQRVQCVQCSGTVPSRPLARTDRSATGARKEHNRSTARSEDRVRKVSQRTVGAIVDRNIPHTDITPTTQHPDDPTPRRPPQYISRACRARHCVLIPFSCASPPSPACALLFIAVDTGHCLPRLTRLDFIPVRSATAERPNRAMAAMNMWTRLLAAFLFLALVQTVDAARLTTTNRVSLPSPLWPTRFLRLVLLAFSHSLAQCRTVGPVGPWPGRDLTRAGHRASALRRGSSPFPETSAVAAAPVSIWPSAS